MPETKKGPAASNDANGTTGDVECHDDNNTIQRPSRMVKLDDIHVDPALQMRAATDEDAIDEYSAVIRAAVADGCTSPLPPVTVIGGYLVDGFHRLAAARRAGVDTIAATITGGSRSDALRASLAANQSHGLRRTNADKRRAIAVAVQTWPSKSDRAIAKLTGVSHTSVANARRLKGGKLCHPVVPMVSGSSEATGEFVAGIDALADGETALCDDGENYTAIGHEATGDGERLFSLLRYGVDETIIGVAKSAAGVQQFLNATDDRMVPKGATQSYTVYEAGAETVAIIASRLLYLNAEATAA